MTDQEIQLGQLQRCCGSSPCPHDELSGSVQRGLPNEGSQVANSDALQLLLFAAWRLG